MKILIQLGIQICLIVVFTILICATAKADSIPVNVLFDKDTVRVGDTLTTTVLYGTPQQPAEDILRIELTIDYDTLVLDSTSHSMDFTNSWFADDQNYSVDESFPYKKLHIELDRTDSESRTGYGKILSSVIIIDNIDHKRSLAGNYTLVLDNMVITKKNGSIVKYDKRITKSLYFDSGIQKAPIGGSEFHRIKYFPNPTKGNLHIYTSDQVTQIEIINPFGIVVKRVSIENSSKVINVSDLPSGVYWIISGEGIKPALLAIQ